MALILRGFAQSTYLYFLILGYWVNAVFSAEVSAQSCGTPEYLATQRKLGLVLESEVEFEGWMQERLRNRKSGSTKNRTAAHAYRIQVVVHIIHKGEPQGEGSNISNEQIRSQIAVLNNDFNRRNHDAGHTPQEFLHLAGAMSIEFVLAEINPMGTPSTGINRVKGKQEVWSRDDDITLKSQSYWPSENYLNIWVCDLSDFRGYAQFPVSTLPGVETSSTNKFTDGIVVSYQNFGSADYGVFPLEPNFNKGRTATHEVGHFFGLRHTWGDVEDCSGTDYVSDTPPQSGPSFGCPSHPVAECPLSLPVNKMFQNYMDLANDGCQNLFTKGQVDRMSIVLENSPRRASLLYAPGSDPPDFEFEKLFSPNGDGVNDYWRWSNTLKYEGCLLTIYNRFGKPVYRTISYDNSWDGRSNEGAVLEAGAYWFVIQCDGRNEIKGGLRIIR